MERPEDQEVERAIPDAEMEFIIAVYALETATFNLSQAFRDMGHALAKRWRQRRRGPSTSGVAGVPCAVDFAWTGEQPIGRIEAVDSSAMIPPRELNRSQRGGE